LCSTRPNPNPQQTNWKSLKSTNTDSESKFDKRFDCQVEESRGFHNPKSLFAEVLIFSSISLDSEQMDRRKGATKLFEFDSNNFFGLVRSLFLQMSGSLWLPEYHLMMAGVKRILS
jgi:hypothetical protein